jgi:hypothetical protein
VTVVVFAIPSRKKRSTSRTPPTMAVAVTSTRTVEVAQAEVVGGDVDEPGAREDRARRRPVEALTVLAELAEDVRVRRGVVEGDRGAVQVGHGGQWPGLAGHRDVPVATVGDGRALPGSATSTVQ